MATKPDVFTWYHWRDGWYFARHKGTGDVAIKQSRDGATMSIIIIPSEQWADIVAHVSKRGGRKAQWQRALELHG